MKEIRIFLASSYELEPDRARIGDLIRRLNDEYEKRFIHLHLVKWEDLDSFYNQKVKQGEYDFQIRKCELFIALFWHCAGCYTVHEVEVARKNISPQNILLFRKDAPFREDCEGSEDIKRFREYFTDAKEDLSLSKQDMERFLEEQKPFFTYRLFPELEAVLTRKIEEYCESIVVSEEDRSRTYSTDSIQIHVAASPEVEPDLARLGDLVRYLDENGKQYCRIRFVPELPGSDMFLSMCHTSAPKLFQDEIASAIKARKESGGTDKPHLYFCMKYLENGMEKDRSLQELEKRFSEHLAHFPDRYTHAPELKLHFILQLEHLKRNSSSDALLIVKNGILYQKNGDLENPLMSCEDMVSLQKDEEYQEMKRRRDELEAEMAELKEKDRTTDQDLSQEIHGIYENLCDIEEQIENRQQGCLRLARLIEEMIGKEQDENILRIRKLLQDGQIERALAMLPKPKDQRQEREARKRRHEAEDQRAYDVCRLTINCLLAGNSLKNRNAICDLYGLLIDIADDLKNNLKKADACLEYASFLHDCGLFDKALEFYQDALDIRLATLGENNQDTAEVYNKIGNVWIDRYYSDKALEFYSKALNIRLHTLGETHPDIGKSYNNIGNVWYRKSDYDKALEYYSKALDIKCNVWGEDHPSVAVSFFGLGNVWLGKCDYDKALEYYNKALGFWLASAGEENPNVATCYNGLGNVWRHKCDYDKALEFYNKSLEIKISLLGEDHPDIANDYNRIGSIWNDKGDSDKALEFYNKALTISLRSFGERCTFVADCYDNIANASQDKGDYDKALEFYGKAQNVRIQLFGEDYPEVAYGYNRIGMGLTSKGDYDKALEVHQKSLELKIRLLGNNHSSVACSYNSIADVWMHKGDFDKVLEFCGKAEDIWSCSDNGNKLSIALNYDMMNWAWQNKGDYKKALECCNKVLDIRLSILGEANPETAWAYFMKGKCLDNLGHKDEAKSCFEKARATALKFLSNTLCRKILEERNV